MLLAQPLTPLLMHSTSLPPPQLMPLALLRVLPLTLRPQQLTLQLLRLQLQLKRH
jgi:hypothetical protein